MIGMFVCVRARLVAFSVAMAVVGPAMSARAEEPRYTETTTPKKTADESDLKRKGDDALVNGRPADALAAYKAAYALRPDAALVYNIGRAHQALGEYPAALEQLEKFEETASPEVRARVPGLPTLLATVRAKVAMVAVTVDVTGATVRLDDRVLGTSPLSGPVRVNAGVVTLVVEKSGFFTYQRVLSLTGGSISTSDVKLASKETKGIVNVRSPIAGAQVALDGKPEGNVPIEIIVTPGSHELVLTSTGYRPTNSSVAVAAGETKTVDLTLESERPIYKKWWFWTGIGVIAIGATITIIALTTERSPDSGNVAPGRINAGLSF
jgi:hypothetical protein